MMGGQFDMFAEQVKDYAAFEVERREGRFEMQAGLYLETKKYNVERGWTPKSKLHCEVRSALILLLVEPCTAPVDVSRVIEFLLADKEAMLLLGGDCGLQRIFLSALLPMKGASDAIYSKAVSILSDNFCLDGKRDEFRDILVSFLKLKDV